VAHVRLAHALQAVGHGTEDVGAAARLQIAEDLHPELRAFGLLDPEPEDVARAVGQDRQGEIDRFAAHRRLVANLDPQGIEEDDGYIGATGRVCQAVTPSITASVTVLIRSGETSTAYISARNAWTSRTVQM
jgi:hypothetical protein